MKIEKLSITRKVGLIDKFEVLDEDDMEAYFEEAKKTLAPFPKCTILRETSMGALKYFADDSLDFVFVDGNHEYEEVYKDITEWTKKVKKGGIMVGHDYIKDDFRKYGIIEAVNQYVEENNIAPLYILEKGTY